MQLTVNNDCRLFILLKLDLNSINLKFKNKSEIEHNG